MQIPILFFVIGLPSFLFLLYCFANDDFVLLRKNVSIEKVFNLAFLVLIAGLFSARLFYVILHFNKAFLNPLVFFLFPYFPGLSFIGGIIGGLLFLLFYAKKNKLPAGRLADLFTLAFYCTLPFGLIINALVITRTFGLIDASILIVFALVCLGGVKVLNKSVLKDGSISILMLLSLAIILFLSDLLKNLRKFSLQGEYIIFFIFFFLLIAFFIRQEKVISRIKK